MGLDASVMCNCYREGKTTPCPFPEHFELDEECFPTLNLSYEGNEAHFDTFEEWLVDCCPHPHMDYAAVFVANWKGYRSFLQALEQMGWEHFPTLHTELPEGNQGLTKSEAAQDALNELERFVTEGSGLTKTFLVDSETGESFASSTMAYGGMFGWNGRTGMSLGFDENGFYIIDVWELNRELFRAKRFEQNVIEAESLDRPQQFEFVDLDSGQRFTCSTPLKLFVKDLSGQLKQTYPHRVHVEQRAVDVNYFTYILEPLRYIFRAAVETGNPVRWS
jgi:hypothetical protein